MFCKKSRIRVELFCVNISKKKKKKKKKIKEGADRLIF